MKYFLDTEFIERPCTIDLISIGVVCEDGREYYAWNIDCDFKKADAWVIANVMVHGPAPDSDLLKTRVEIAQDLYAFCGEDMGDRSQPEFWGYYADYDWVVFCWLFGKMDDLPKGWPMYCRDIKQACDHFGPEAYKVLPAQPEDEHNALVDARWNAKALEALFKYELKQLEVRRNIAIDRRDDERTGRFG